ncbi:hypothetical protein MZK49_22095 [Ensifer sesbaniae]|nr:hypothetical protein [Ensifer sesbaniae]
MVDQLAGALERARIPTVRYHGKMRASDRAAAQRRFMRPSRRLIMVATSAFGMGIDKPNIRYIIHYQAPGSLEQYVQEVGRAGRDGEPAHCILLFNAADLEIQGWLQALSRLTARHLERLETALAAWATEHRAPTAAALAYSANVPVRIGEVLLSDLEQAGLVQRDQEGDIIVVVPLEIFQARARDLVAKLKRFRFESERRLAPSPITPSLRNAGACSSGGTLVRRTRRAAGPATAAAPSPPRPVVRARCASHPEKRDVHVTGKRVPRTRVDEEKAAGMLHERLRLMHVWFEGMVDEGTGRLLHLYDPENDVAITDGEPIREIAAI